MGKQLTDAEKKSKAKADRAAKAEAAKAKSDAEKKAAEDAIKDAESGDTEADRGEKRTVPVEPCPACPDGMHRLRSRFPSYRWRNTQFHGNCAIVDPATLERAKRDPAFGQGRDFWEDKAA